MGQAVQAAPGDQVGLAVQAGPVDRGELAIQGDPAAGKPPIVLRVDLAVAEAPVPRRGPLTVPPGGRV